MLLKRGFIVNLIILIIALVILNYYFGDKIKEIIFSQKTKDFLLGVWHFIVYIWVTYLYHPLLEVWNKVVLGIIWPTLKHLFGKASQYR